MATMYENWYNLNLKLDYKLEVEDTALDQKSEWSIDVLR